MHWTTACLWVTIYTLRCPRTRTTDPDETATETRAGVKEDREGPLTCRCRQAGTTCRACRTGILPRTACQVTACRPQYRALREVVLTPLLLLLLQPTPGIRLPMVCLILLPQCLCSTVSSSRTTSRGTGACRHFPPECTVAAESAAAGAGPAVGAPPAPPRGALPAAPTAGPPAAGPRLPASTGNTNVHIHLEGNDVTQDHHGDKARLNHILISRFQPNCYLCLVYSHPFYLCLNNYLLLILPWIILLDFSSTYCEHSVIRVHLMVTPPRIICITLFCYPLLYIFFISCSFIQVISVVLTPSVKFRPNWHARVFARSNDDNSVILDS